MAIKLVQIVKATVDELTAQGIDKSGGIQSKSHLARATKIPPCTAASVPDSEENLAKFREAYKTLTGKVCPI